MADTQRRCSSSCKPRWRPTSSALLEETEKKLFGCLKSNYEVQKVILPSSQNELWTLVVNPGHKSTTPLVMVHGFGGGIGLWIQNLDELAKDRTVYAFDLLGFGRSSRPTFSSNSRRAEAQFVDSIEEWRKQMGLNKVILLGHSFGAFLSTAFTIKHPDVVKHLISVDPWGFPEVDIRQIPMRYRVIATIAKPFNPLAVLRVAGPWGPDLLKRFRGDLQEKFAHLFNDNSINDYIYHCNARKPSGESGFRSMSEKLGQAKHPMVHRVSEIRKDIPMTMIHGEESWMKWDVSYEVKRIRKESRVNIEVIEEAGHHVYADQADVFNDIVTELMRDIDNTSPHSMLPNGDKSTAKQKTDKAPSTEVEVH